MKTNSDTTTKLYIGLDVHKEKTAIALAEPTTGGEVRYYGEVATTQIALERTIRKIAKSRGADLPEIHIAGAPTDTARGLPPEARLAMAQARATQARLDALTQRIREIPVEDPEV